MEASHTFDPQMGWFEYTILYASSNACSLPTRLQTLGMYCAECIKAPFHMAHYLQVFMLKFHILSMWEMRTTGRR